MNGGLHNKTVAGSDSVSGPSEVSPIQNQNICPRGPFLGQISAHGPRQGGWYRNERLAGNPAARPVASFRPILTPMSHIVIQRCRKDSPSYQQRTFPPTCMGWDGQMSDQTPCVRACIIMTRMSIPSATHLGCCWVGTHYVEWNTHPGCVVCTSTPPPTLLQKVGIRHVIPPDQVCKISNKESRPLDRHGQQRNRS